MRLGLISLLSSLAVSTIVLAGKSPRLTFQGIDVKLPILLPQVRLAAESTGGFRFEYNDCDGGFWETVVFGRKEGTLVFVTFNTPVIRGGTASQNAVAAMEGGNHFIKGITGQFQLLNAKTNANRVILKTLKGRLDWGAGTLANDSDAKDRPTPKATEEIELKEIPYSRTNPFDYESMLSDLRALPGCGSATLRKMCN
jgi:hypothetical protein